MPTLHLIKNDPKLPGIFPIKGCPHVYESGYWVMADQTAKGLVGGSILFHDRQTQASFFGGIITEATKTTDGKYAGRFVFKFTYDPVCKGVRTSRDGWAMEMKIVK